MRYSARDGICPVTLCDSAPQSPAPEPLSQAMSPEYAAKPRIIAKIHETRNEWDIDK